MSAIKQCGRCGNKAPHHYEVDNICMQCEMEQYHPGDTVTRGLVGQLQSNAIVLDLADKTLTLLKKQTRTLSKLHNMLKFKL
ncbi:MAG TPA: hypothetical protein ENH85_02200 [Candidatus Scalindua sp.]|nr:hypothetical protein [Candidatus Scalindua sp.]